MPFRASGKRPFTVNTSSLIQERFGPIEDNCERGHRKKAVFANIVLKKFSIFLKGEHFLDSVKGQRKILLKQNSKSDQL